MKKLALGFLTVLATACGVSEQESSVKALYPQKDLESVNLWKVTTKALNCRADAGATAPLIYTDLPTSTYMDSMKEVKKDAQGRSWVLVVPRSNIDRVPCYVLAEKSFIAPVVTKLGSLSEIEGDMSCQINIPRSDLISHLETSKYKIYICKSNDKYFYVSYTKNSSTPFILAGDENTFYDGTYIFQNGSYQYVIKTPEAGRYPVANLGVYRFTQEFPTLIDIPALRYLQ
jgi:hypothetical protein